MKRFALLVSVSMAALLPAAVGAQPGGAAPVKVALAEHREMTPAMQVPGTVLSRFDAVLSAEVDGRLLEVADVGTQVAKGDAVARIEDTALKLRKAELEADLRRGEARLSYLESALARVERLAETNLAAVSQIDETRSDRDMALADLEVTRSRLEQLRDQIERTRIEAPFSGVVVERLARAGERVGSGAEVVRMVDPDSLEIVARAPLRYYPFVSSGDFIEISAADQLFHAPLRTKVSVGSENLHVFELRMDIQESLPVGQTVRVTVPTSEMREVLAVPRDALVLRGTGTTVFVVSDDYKARQARVATGIGQGDWIEVSGPIQPGDQVIVRGNERLSDGQSVLLMEG
ncbi:MAG TPA: efflux RND transporter periplasmic adaptor subunit [Wenzhouxiangella sp.]|nr:efflux RND transporter periplasmic adaptor subunit [Wenzhouxiangella sp.]